MKDEFIYKIWTKDNRGQMVLLCKTDNPNSAQDIMQAMCSYYPNWTLELWRKDSKEDVKCSWRYPQK